jgi:hypothetical protein
MRIPAAVAALLLLSAGPSRAADLAAHRALYALTLGSTQGEDVTAATGTMAYEVTDACEAWAVRQRLEMSMTNQHGQQIKMVSDYATWESKDGLRIRFHMRQTTDTAVTEQVDGDAHLDRVGGPGQVHYTTPADTMKPLPAGTYFPMAHTGAIIDAAAEGKPATRARRTPSSPSPPGTRQAPRRTRIWRNSPAVTSMSPSSTAPAARPIRITRWACATGRMASPTSWR